MIHFKKYMEYFSFQRSLGLSIAICLHFAAPNAFSGQFAFSHLIHPGFDMYDILPKEWVADQPDKNPIGGIALLPDGRMVTTTWSSGASDTIRNGKAFILSGVLSATTGSEVSVEPLSTSLRDPLGVTVVDGVIYVLEKDRLARFTTDGTGWKYGIEYDKANPVGVLDFFQWYSMGLVYAQGKFNWTIAAINAYGSVVDPEPLKHGAWVQYDPITKTHEYMAYGLRSTGGTILGPEGTICTTDNDGDWVASDKLVCMEKGLWYGYGGPTFPARKPDQEVIPPTVWGAHDEITNSLGDGILIPKGKYSGQMFITDLTNGVLDRVFFEKINGHWQGAFTFVTGGFNAGAFRMLLAPDSTTLVVGSIGGVGGGWKYQDYRGSVYAGLSRLVPNNKPVLEILAVRSLGPTKMEVEFTEPVDSSAGLVENYTVTSWKNIYKSPSSFGKGNNLFPLKHFLAGVELSADHLKAILSFSNLEEGRVVRVFVNPVVKSINGDTLFFKYADYTLNHFGPAEKIPLNQILNGSTSKPFRYELHYNQAGLELKMDAPGAHSIEVFSVKGIRLKSIRKFGPFTLSLNKEFLGTGVFMLRIINESGPIISRLLNF